MKWKEITVGQVTIHFIKTEKFLNGLYFWLH